MTRSLTMVLLYALSAVFAVAVAVPVRDAVNASLQHAAALIEGR